MRNAQGDIIKLIDSTGTVVVEYTYDAWGKLISTSGTMASTLGVDNPFRYRGYYYDNETGLYYLNARYYNPTWGRFINADSYGGTVGGLLSHNMFAYCGNNPVMRSDPSGHIWYYGNTVQSSSTSYKEAKEHEAKRKASSTSNKTLTYKGTGTYFYNFASNAMLLGEIVRAELIKTDGDGTRKSTFLATRNYGSNVLDIINFAIDQTFGVSETIPNDSPSTKDPFDRDLHIDAGDSVKSISRCWSEPRFAWWEVEVFVYRNDIEIYHTVYIEMTLSD